MQDNAGKNLSENILTPAVDKHTVGYQETQLTVEATNNSEKNTTISKELSIGRKISSNSNEEATSDDRHIEGAPEESTQENLKVKIPETAMNYIILTISLFWLAFSILSYLRIAGAVSQESHILVTCILLLLQLFDCSRF